VPGVPLAGNPGGGAQPAGVPLRGVAEAGAALEVDRRSTNSRRCRARMVAGKLVSVPRRREVSGALSRKNMTAGAAEQPGAGRGWARSRARLADVLQQLCGGSSDLHACNEPPKRYRAPSRRERHRAPNQKN
jgi:hypothetical protein